MIHPTSSQPPPLPCSGACPAPKERCSSSPRSNAQAPERLLTSSPRRSSEDPAGLLPRRRSTTAAQARAPLTLALVPSFLSISPPLSLSLVPLLVQEEHELPSPRHGAVPPLHRRHGTPAPQPASSPHADPRPHASPCPDLTLAASPQPRHGLLCFAPPPAQTARSPASETRRRAPASSSLPVDRSHLVAQLQPASSRSASPRPASPPSRLVGPM